MADVRRQKGHQDVTIWTPHSALAGRKKIMTSALIGGSGKVLHRRLAGIRSDNGNIIITMHDEQLGLARNRDHCVSGSVARCDLETAATRAALIAYRRRRL